MKILIDIMSIIITIILWFLFLYYFNYIEIWYPFAEEANDLSEADGIINKLLSLIFNLLFVILTVLPLPIILVIIFRFSNNIFGFSIGKLTLENGDQYEGELRKDKMDGKGIYTFENGEIYKGRFRNNKFHGKGVYTYPDGTIKTGKWKNDELFEMSNSIQYRKCKKCKEDNETTLEICWNCQEEL